MSKRTFEQLLKKAIKAEKVGSGKGSRRGGYIEKKPRSRKKKASGAKRSGGSR